MRLIPLVWSCGTQLIQSTVSSRNSIYMYSFIPNTKYSSEPSSLEPTLVKKYS